MAEKIQIRCKYALGDVVVLTAAVRDIARAYPGRFDISVDTGNPEVWLHNPYVKPRIFPGTVIDCQDAIIDRPGVLGRHYVHAYLDLLNEQLGTRAELSAVKGDIHLSAEERSWYSDIWNLCGREIPYWLICSGGKFDLPIKWWDQPRFQQVVNALRGRIQFVQVGWWGNHHPPLEGAIDLRGQTTVRDLIHLMHHADGVLCGVTSLMHLAAAVPMRDVERAAIVVAGDREPRAWEAYPGHLYLTAGKQMPCGNCWNHRVAEAGETGKGICERGIGGMPECLDAVTPERVLEAFEQLHATGRIRFQRASERSFAWRAIIRARARSDFDLHNINERNASAKAQEFLDSLAPYPEGKFAGRGIVICAGGSSYFTQAWVCLRMLRQLGCTLPVEVWHFGAEELDATMAGLLASLNVRCVDARERMKTAPMRNPLGWELKCYSVLHSRFREVLSLDADNVPVVDPTFLFDTPEYRDKGAIFWPDYGSLGTRRKIWKLCGVSYRREPEFESGQMVIDKEPCWRALNLAWWYNDHSEFFYKHIHGDKDTFHLAWRRAGTDYAMPPYAIESLEGVMCQHDFQGRRIFQHRNSHKWTFFGDNKRIAGFLFEEDCRGHIEALRARWDGKINGARQTREWQGARLRVQSIDEEVWKCVALHNEYKLPSSFEARDLILDIGAHTGSFVKACHERGSRAIHAFEPQPENMELARQNVGGLPGVRLYEGAVLDKQRPARLAPFSPAIGRENTGSAAILNKPGRLKTYSINTLLEQFGCVALMKLDCEGSEWPILEAIKQWHRIESICGEYHLRPGDSITQLRSILAPRFSFVRIEKPNEEGLGKFCASHIRGPQSDADFGRQSKLAHRSRE